jgi:hypothetical protein
VKLEKGKKYRVTFEGEYEGQQGVSDHHRFRANDLEIGAWLKEGSFEFELAFGPEPPVASVAVDNENVAWQRHPIDKKWRRIQDGMYGGAGYGLSWYGLNKSSFGPVKVVYTAPEPADAS